MKSLVPLISVVNVAGLPSTGTVPEMMHESLPIDANGLPDVDSYGHTVIDESGGLAMNAQEALGQNSLQLAILGSLFLNPDL